VTLNRVVRSGRFDLVHAHLGLSEVLAAAAVPLDVPIVASRRGRNIGFDTNPLLRLVEGLGHRRASVLITNAQWWADVARERDLWTPPTRVIPNGVDLERFEVAPLPEGPPTVAVVANLRPYKGHERFLRALAVARRAVPDARAILVGDGIERRRMERLARDLRLGSAVTFTGLVPDTRPFVRRSNVVALTSDHEGLPNALIEAMAMGRPLIATRCGGTREIVDDGVNGLLVTHDVDAIASALIDVLGDPVRQHAMAIEARARAERFSWRNIVARTEAVYGRVLGRSAPA
jgi:glycosyltransferase involved in cell wall biosynthesis